MAAMCLLPLSSIAQNDNWFTSSNDNYQNREGNTFTNNVGTGNQGFGQTPVPVGSGLLILTAIGASYALAKSKKTRKKAGLMVMAFAIVMGMTQCKKNLPTVNSDSAYDGPTTHITLSLLSRSDGGSKAEVLPNDGDDVAPVRFLIGDKIIVGYNGKWVGTLVCTSLSDIHDQNNFQLGVFTGDIDADAPATGTKPLYFYFLGNKEPVKDATGQRDKLTVNLSDQTSELPVISYAASKEYFSQDITNYTVEYNWLMNQCALVKFEFENIYDMSANTYDNNADAIYQTTKNITIYGMENQLTVEMCTENFTWSQAGDGAIKLFSRATDANTKRYAIVHNGTHAITDGNLMVDFDPATDSHGFYGTYKLNGEIALNDYYQDGKLDLVWHSGAFSVASGSYVVFSRGNLQYAHLASGTRAAQTWRFAKHQYDFAGGVDDNNVQQGNVVQIETANLGDARSNNENIGAGDYYGWIDLFGWGTGNNPTLHTTGNTDYTDWHEYGLNNIVNSGKPGNTSWWTTLTHTEWNNVINRNDKDKVGLATITGIGFGTPDNIYGMVILPDQITNPHSWRSIKDATTGLGLNYAEYSDNSYTVGEWIEMEEAGAVFLPATGYRNGTNWRATLNSGTALEHGAYYSSTQRTQTTSVYSLRFGTDYHTQDRINEDYYMAGDNGHNVRLVHRLN